MQEKGIGMFIQQKEKGKEGGGQTQIVRRKPRREQLPVDRRTPSGRELPY